MAEKSKNNEADTGRGEAETGGGDSGFSYTDAGGEEATLSFWRRRKRSVATAIILSALGLGGIGGFFFLSGPLQIVHFASLLRGFHLTNNEEAVDSRTGRLIRYLRYPDTPQNRRIGVLQRSYAGNIEGKLRARGFDPQYSRGTLTHYELDPGRVDIDRLRQEGLNIEGNRLLPDDSRTDTTRRFIRSVVRQTGYSRVGSAIHSRVLIKKAGVGFRFLGNVRKRPREPIAEWRSRVREDYERRVKRGTYSNVDTGAREAQDDTDAERQRAQEAENASNQGEDFTNADGRGEAKVRNTKARLTRTGLGSAAVVGLLCTIQGVANASENIKHANITLPLMRMGWRIIVTGNQVMSGQDVSFDELAVTLEQLETEEFGSWSNARSIQHELDQPLTGPDIPESARLDGGENLLSRIIGSVPGLSFTCQAASNIIGQAALVAIDLFTGGIPAAVSGEIFSRFAAPPLVDAAARSLAAEQVSADATGAVLGNYANYGTRLAANEQSISMAGRQLSNDEVVQLDSWSRQLRKQDDRHKGIGYRVFAVTNPHSLVSRLALAAGSTSPRSLLNSIVQTPTSIATKLSNLFAPANVYAQDSSGPYDYGFPEYGFSLDELNDPQLENPYENAKILGPRLDKLNDEYAKDCFGLQFDKKTDRFTVLESTPDTPPSKCNDTSNQELTRYRMYILDTMTMESLACFHGEAEACNRLGLGSN